MYILETSAVNFELTDENAKELLRLKLVVLEKGNIVKLDGSKLYDANDVEEILDAINGEVEDE